MKASLISFLLVPLCVTSMATAGELQDHSPGHAPMECTLNQSTFDVDFTAAIAHESPEVMTFVVIATSDPTQCNVAFEKSDTLYRSVEYEQRGVTMDPNDNLYKPGLFNKHYFNEDKKKAGSNKSPITDPGS